MPRRVIFGSRSKRVRRNWMSIRKMAKRGGLSRFGRNICSVYYCKNCKDTFIIHPGEKHICPT